MATMILRRKWLRLQVNSLINRKQQSRLLIHVCYWERRFREGLEGAMQKNKQNLCIEGNGQKQNISKEKRKFSA